MDITYSNIMKYVLSTEIGTHRKLTDKNYKRTK